MIELLVGLSTIVPLWVIAWLLWRREGEPERKSRARAVSVYACSCAYLDYAELDERTGGSPWPCYCGTGCLVAANAEDCPCQCRTRGCYQEMVYQGYRE